MPDNIINPQFVWQQAGRDYYIELAYFGSAFLEFQPGEGYSVRFNNCGQIRPTPCSKEGGFLETPVPIYYQDLEIAKYEALSWARTIIEEGVQELELLMLRFKPSGY